MLQLGGLDRTVAVPPYVRGNTHTDACCRTRICDRAVLRIPVGKRLPGKYREGAVADFARAVPEGPSVAFTDGSAKPNPGPCGAGIVLRLAGKQSYIHIAIPLGFGDNNKGEMGAFYGLFEKMLRMVAEGRVDLGTELIVFSDSAICIGFLLHGWALKTWPALGEATRALSRKLRAVLCGTVLDS